MILSFRRRQSGARRRRESGDFQRATSVVLVTVGPRRAADRTRFAVGIPGVVLAHLAGYMVVFPEGSQRAQALAATGHGYWHLAALAAVAAGACSVVAAVGRGMASVRGKGTSVVD